MITYPVRQGTTLRTRSTEKWSQEQWDSNQAVEKCRVYSNFTLSDEGRSRQLVAVCTNPQEAAKLVIVLNDGMKAIKAIEKIKQLSGPSLNMSDITRILEETK